MRCRMVSCLAFTLFRVIFLTDVQRLALGIVDTSSVGPVFQNTHDQFHISGILVKLGFYYKKTNWSQASICHLGRNKILKF